MRSWWIGRNRLMGLVIMGALLPGSVSGDADAGHLERFTYTQLHMGIEVRITLFAPTEIAAQNACAAAFRRIAELEAIMSDYRKDSELNRVCDRAGGRPVRVSPELFLVLQRARDLSFRTDGAFDVTAAPLVALWRQARRSGQMPDPAALTAAKKLVGWRMMELDACDRTVRLRRKGMRLDLGGIAKGYAGDEAQRVLAAHGIDRAMIELGGDIVVSGPPPGTDGWMIRVPNAGDDQGPRDLRFARCGVSTSGDTEQFVVIGGVRYSHVVDPKTGLGLSHRVQATVVAPDGLTADPLSTAMTLVAPRDRDFLAAQFPGVSVFVRVAKGQ